jgi:hypothetical protein
MLPRSLMIPPGIPDFATRERRIAMGTLRVRGRAWSGFGAIARVEASADGGETWSDAELGPQPSRWAWRAWEWEWDAERAGVHELCCRATDEEGNVQPVAAPWNLGGYANNEVHRVPVVVHEPGAFRLT